MGFWLHREVNRHTGARPTKAKDGQAVSAVEWETFYMRFTRCTAINFNRFTAHLLSAVTEAHHAQRPRARRTSSALALIALDLATGKLRWHYQLVSPDICGYDAASLPVLLDLPGPNKQPVPMLAAASKSGWI